MNCDELKELYELYALGLAEDPERQEIEAHLGRGCETCRRGLKEALVMNTLLLATSTEAAPPRRLKRRVMASVGVERSGWGWAAGLAAACLLLIALWLGVQERQRGAELADARLNLLETRLQRDKLRQAMSFLNQPETRQVGFGKGLPAPPRGNVFVNPQSGVLLIVSNLPALGAGKTYEMWILPKSGSPRPAGLFQSDASGSGVNIMSGPLDMSAMNAIAVTVEPASGSPGPTTTPIIVAPMAGF